MKPELNSLPVLAVGCRLSEKGKQARVLHMPEKILRLNGPSLEIVERCDGQHTVGQLISELQALYSAAVPEKVQSDILGYLELLKDQRAIDFEAARASASHTEK